MPEQLQMEEVTDQVDENGFTHDAWHDMVSVCVPCAFLYAMSTWKFVRILRAQMQA